MSDLVKVCFVNGVLAQVLVCTIKYLTIYDGLKPTTATEIFKPIYSNLCTIELTRTGVKYYKSIAS